jgi:hypothetical protein
MLEEALQEMSMGPTPQADAPPASAPGSQTSAPTATDQPEYAELDAMLARVLQEEAGSQGTHFTPPVSAAARAEQEQQLQLQMALEGYKNLIKFYRQDPQGMREPLINIVQSMPLMARPVEEEGKTASSVVSLIVASDDRTSCKEAQVDLDKLNAAERELVKAIQQLDADSVRLIAQAQQAGAMTPACTEQALVLAEQQQALVQKLVAAGKVVDVPETPSSVEPVDVQARREFLSSVGLEDSRLDAIIEHKNFESEIMVGCVHVLSTLDDTTISSIFSELPGMVGNPEAFVEKFVELLKEKLGEARFASLKQNYVTYLKDHLK